MKKTVTWSTDPNVVQTIAQDSFGGWERAINEAVKNSLDANAAHIQLTAPNREIMVGLDQQTVVIADDGDGMSFDELANRYCRFGRHKPNHRGTGKVATFKVANTVVFETWRDGRRHSIEFPTAPLLGTRGGAFPESEVETTEVPDGSSGTRLTLIGFRDDTHPPSLATIHHVLLRNFHHRPGLEFYVNGTAFLLEDYAEEVLSVTSEAIEGVGTGSLTVLLTRQKDRPRDPGIMICAGGQTIHGPDLFDLDNRGYRGDAGKALHRILGRLDLYPTDNRAVESGVWSMSDQYALVREWAGQHLESVVTKETAGVVQSRVEKWLQDPPTRRFYEKLPPDEKSAAKRILRGQAMKTGGQTNTAQTVINRLVCRSLHSDALDVVLDVLDDSSAEEVENFSELFKGHDKWTLRQVTRAASLVKHHMQAVEDLESCVADYSRNECEIHGILKENPWLIADDFHSFRSNRQIRTTLKKLFGIDTEDKESLKRPDFFFALGDVASSSLEQAGRFLFVELKGPAQPLDSSHQFQVVGDAKEFMRHQPGYAFCILIGTEFNPKSPPDHETDSKGSYSFKSMTYDRVIERARFRLEYIADGVKESGAEELARRVRQSEVEMLIDTAPRRNKPE